MRFFDFHAGALESGAPAAFGELRQQYRDLRLLVNLALTCLLGLSLTVDLFVYKQMRLVRIKVSETRPWVQRLTTEFNRREPTMHNFVNALQSYAFTNSQFYAVLSKYTNSLPQYFASPMRVPSALPGSILPPLRESAEGAAVIKPAGK
jgi:hypothetical protein